VYPLTVYSREFNRDISAYSVERKTKLFSLTKKINRFQIAVLGCLNGQWKIKTSFRINPITDFIELFTHICEDNIKMDPRELRLERVDWIRVAQDRD